MGHHVLHERFLSHVVEVGTKRDRKPDAQGTNVSELVVDGKHVDEYTDEERKERKGKEKKGKKDAGGKWTKKSIVFDGNSNGSFQERSREAVRRTDTRSTRDRRHERIQKHDRHKIRKTNEHRQTYEHEPTHPRRDNYSRNADRTYIFSGSSLASVFN